MRNQALVDAHWAAARRAIARRSRGGEEQAAAEKG